MVFPFLIKKEIIFHFSLFTFHFLLYLCTAFRNIATRYRGVAQLVAHLVWDQVVARSSRVTPTFFVPYHNPLTQNKRIAPPRYPLY